MSFCPGLCRFETPILAVSVGNKSHIYYPYRSPLIKCDLIYPGSSLTRGLLLIKSVSHLEMLIFSKKECLAPVAVLEEILPVLPDLDQITSSELKAVTIWSALEWLMNKFGLSVWAWSLNRMILQREL